MRASLDGFGHEVVEHEFSDSFAPVVRVYADGGDVGFVHNDPHARVSDDPLFEAGGYVVGGGVVDLGDVGADRPGGGEASDVEVDHLVYVFQPHFLDGYSVGCFGSAPVHFYRGKSSIKGAGFQIPRFWVF